MLSLHSPRVAASLAFSSRSLVRATFCRKVCAQKKANNDQSRIQIVPRLLPRRRRSLTAAFLSFIPFSHFCSTYASFCSLSSSGCVGPFIGLAKSGDHCLPPSVFPDRLANRIFDDKDSIARKYIMDRRAAGGFIVRWIAAAAAAMFHEMQTSLVSR